MKWDWCLRFWRPVSSGPESWAVFVFLAHALLIQPAFFARLPEINAWDEAVYMNNGRELIAGHLPVFALYPLVTFVYALCYLPVQSSLTWMTDVWTLSRIVFFVLLWWSGFLVARQLSRWARPAVFVGLMVVLPVLPRLFENATYAMFAAMSSFALWQFLCFYHNRKSRHLLIASLFLALSAMSRSEGFVLFACVLLLSTLVVKPKQWLSTLYHCALPFLLVVGGYILVYGLSTGRFELGTQEKSYQTFEQGHGVAFARDYADRAACIEGQLDARKLFGTPEQNQNSIFRAIARNPRAYLSRVAPLSDQVSRSIYDRYGRGVAAICFLFAVRGLVALVRGRHYMLVVTLLLWSAYVVLYFILCYQPAAVLMPFAVMIGLSAIGISAAVANFDCRSEQIAWLVSLVALTGALSAATANVETPLTLAVFSLALVAVWFVQRRFNAIDQKSKATEAVLYCLLLASVLLIKAEYPVRRLPLVESAEEQASLFMRCHLRPGSAVGTWAPGIVWSSNMKAVTMERDYRKLQTDEDFAHWMRHEKLQGFFIDPLFRRYEPEVCAMIDRQIGRTLETGFVSTNNACSVLLVKSDENTSTPLP